MNPQTMIERLAVLFGYPGPDFHRHVTTALEAMGNDGGANGDAKGLLTQFAAATAEYDTDELRELYTRTFDLNPLCTLEIGWQLYGEDYHRGEFLVKMRQQLRQYQLRESTELPDHMTHAMALLARLEPDEAAEFAGSYLLPALDKMVSGWREHRNGYSALLESVFAFLKSRYTYVPLPTAFAGPELPVLQ